MLTPTVIALAQAAYDERLMPSGELDPARLAVLSDALEEAGCDDAGILNHLRSAGAARQGMLGNRYTPREGVMPSKAPGWRLSRLILSIPR